MDAEVQTVRVSAESVREALGALFATLGMSEEHARMSAADMVQTNLWGIDSHGLLRLPIYVERLAENVIKARPDIRVVAGRAAYAFMDGDAGMGYVVGRAAMDKALELAAEYGIGAATVTNSNHFGAASLFARQATEAGFIGLALTNVTPNLVVPGGARPITGNNPIAFGAPTDLGFPLLLDISMSAVAGGKLLMASKEGVKIPLDWATDRNGHPTDDPDIGFAGFLLPLGGHKGFGLSLMVDILCGVISGGAFQFGIKGMYTHPDDPSLTCHTMVAIDPAIAVDRDAFLQRMGEMYRTVKSSPMWAEGSEMFIPGEIENRTQQERLAKGIPLPTTLHDELLELCDRFGAPRFAPSDRG